MSDGFRDDREGYAGAGTAGTKEKRFDRVVFILWRSVLGGTLMMVPGALGFIAGNLWLFPSLGPSIFLLVIAPHLKTSRTYNTFMGHLIGIACGYFAALICGVTGIPPALPAYHLLAPHVAAAGLAIGAMILLQLAAKAEHAPGASTALLITLGAFKPTWQDCLMLVAGVAIMTVVAEAARLFLIREEEELV